jgi:hypothetical protein
MIIRQICFLHSMLEHFNNILHKLNNALLIMILVVIPLGLIYQTVESYQFMENCPDPRVCHSWVGMLYMILIPTEIYIGLIFFWLKALKHANTTTESRLVQLVIISLIGVVPGLVLMFSAVFAD